MSSINKVILIGHMGTDPDFRKLEGDISVVVFPLVTSEITVKNGVRTEQAEWHNIVMWRGLADVAARMLSKGKLVHIEGKCRSRSFNDKNGIHKYITEVVADSFNLLGRSGDFENDIADPGLTADSFPKVKRHRL